MNDKKKFIEGLQKAWGDEVRSALNYRALANREPGPDKKNILIRMAEAEERHAETWAIRLRELGADPGEYHESMIDRIRRWVLLRSDTTAAAKILEAGERDADSLYDILLRDRKSVV